MSFRFADPYFLLFVLLIPLVDYLVKWKKDRYLKPAIQYSSLTNVKLIPSSWKIIVMSSTRFFRMLILLLLVFAFARPQSVSAREIVKGEGVDIVIALDISGSMGIVDYEENSRLEIAKDVIEEFVATRKHDRIGLVIFAKDVFNQSPPTVDQKMILYFLNQIELAEDAGLEDGTALGMGVASAANMLKDSSSKGKVIILLTDGVNNSGKIDPLMASEAARIFGIKIYAIGLGNPLTEVIPIENGDEETNQINPHDGINIEELQQMARITDGKFFLANSVGDLSAIYQEINRLEKSEFQVTMNYHHKDLAMWLIIPAVILMLVEFSIREILFSSLP